MLFRSLWVGLCVRYRVCEGLAVRNLGTRCRVQGRELVGLVSVIVSSLGI